MKKLTLVVLSFVLVMLFTTSCEKEEDKVSFDETLIIGKWKSGTLFERYDSDKSGATWDTADDVTEAEGQEFTWTIEIDQLEQIHILENGGLVPKVYTLTTLTASTLVYEDDFGSVKTFRKQ
jgi:hypothetical protein